MSERPAEPPLLSAAPGRLRGPCAAHAWRGGEGLPAWGEGRLRAPTAAGGPAGTRALRPGGRRVRLSVLRPGGCFGERVAAVVAVVTPVTITLCSWVLCHCRSEHVLGAARSIAAASLSRPGEPGWGAAV